MRLKDLHELPKIRDSWSYLYVEHCRIDQDAKAIALDSDQAMPGGIWDPEVGPVEGGLNYADLLEEPIDSDAAGASLAQSAR